jgi:general secretion pathway protein H
MKTGPREGTEHPLQAGFSLVEMMVVLIILALIAGLGIPMLHVGRGGKNPSATALELQAMFQQARTNAISRGSTETVEFDLAKREVIYRTMKQIVRIPDNIQSSLLVGRELVATDGVSTLLFFPDGGSTGIKIILADGNKLPVNVVVPWLTGVSIVTQAQNP